MLVVHLPAEGILYQSDLFMPSGSDFPDPTRVPVMKWFVDWLDASGLEPETIYAIHGPACGRFRASMRRIVSATRADLPRMETRRCPDAAP